MLVITGAGAQAQACLMDGPPASPAERSTEDDVVAWKPTSDNLFAGIVEECCELDRALWRQSLIRVEEEDPWRVGQQQGCVALTGICLLYTSDAADERSSVDLGGRRIIKKKKKLQHIHINSE